MKLSLNIASVIGLRAASLALSLAGQSRAANSVNAVADGIEAGTAIDEHMQLAHQRIKTGMIWTPGSGHQVRRSGTLDARSAPAVVPRPDVRA